MMLEWCSRIAYLPPWLPSASDDLPQAETSVASKTSFFTSSAALVFNTKSAPLHIKTSILSLSVDPQMMYTMQRRLHLDHWLFASLPQSMVNSVEVYTHRSESILQGTIYTCIVALSGIRMQYQIIRLDKVVRFVESGY